MTLQPTHSERNTNNKVWNETNECMSVPDNIRKQPKNERALSADSLNKIMSSRHGTTLLSAVVSLGKSYSTKYNVQYSKPQKGG